jgi:predicted transcriptional regulator
MRQEFSVIRVKTETLKRIRKLAEKRNTTPPRLLDEMVLDYEMDLREVAELHAKSVKIEQ